MAQPSTTKEVDSEKINVPVSTSLENVTTFAYNTDGDTNGIVYSQNGGNHRNEESGIVTTASSVAVGEACDFINREKTRCWTQNLPYSWFCVDFGQDRSIIPSHYTVGYGSSGSACLPRFWIFQGAKKLTRSDHQYGSNDTPQNDIDWKTLSIHNNDVTLNSEWALHTWKLNCKDSFRYFRIVQTGPNSFNSSGGEDNWSQVLVVNRFEIYGTLLGSNNSSPSTTPSVITPVFYGSSSSNKYVAPQLIRADPSITKEIQELIVFLMRPQNETKAEKVKVHDILL